MKKEEDKGGRRSKKKGKAAGGKERRREGKNMEISLKLESMPTLCRSAFLPADTTITRRVAATIEVASSVVHRKE